MRRLARILFFIVLPALCTCRSAVAAESVDSMPPLHGSWIRQLVQSGFKLNDPRIEYPRFPRFCLNVYNWIDGNFNSFDPNYVVSPIGFARVQFKNYNWSQGYVYNFALDTPENKVWLHTDLRADMGIQVNLLAFSFGATWNANKWFRRVADRRETYNFSVTTSRFSFDLSRSSSDTHGTLINAEFRDRDLQVPIDQYSLDINAYYFFNHRRYSQSAAYGFSKIQIRSAGSWLLGVDYNRQRLTLDFKSMPEDFLDRYPELPLHPSYRYTDYNLLGGYAYNFVLGRDHKWLINLTGLPFAGYKRQPHKKSSRRELLSLGGIGRSAVVFNHRRFFAGTLFYINGNFYLTRRYALFNSMESVTVHVGVRI